MEDHVRGLGLDRHTRIADQHLDAVCLEVRQQRGARLGLLQGEKPWTGLDDRDLRTQPCECLGKLDPYRTAAEHDQPLGQLPRDGGLAVGPVGDFVEPFDRRYGRGAAVGDDHGPPRHQLVAADFDRTQVDERAGAPVELGACRLERGRRPSVVQVARHPQHALGDLREVDLPLDARGGEGARPAGFFECLPGPKQGF